MDIVTNRMQLALEKRENQGLLRKLRYNNGLVDFCSNDYLGFARNTELSEKAFQTIENEKRINISGSTGSRLISGNSGFAEFLEQKIALFHKSEAALIYNSGYDANLGLFASVPQKGDTIFYDELIHASIRDGVRLSNANSYSFKHNDLNDLERIFDHASGNVFITVESVYSMDGDQAPLIGLVAVCEKHGANLIVDEAHATGVFGMHGRGLCEEHGVAQKVFARVHTFGKALGCHGAVVCGSNVLRDFLINFSRSFIYTTALPMHSLAFIDAAYEMLIESEKAKLLLKENINHFVQTSLSLLPGRFIPSESAIHCMVTGGNRNTSEIAAKIQSRGFDVRPILSPTVREGYERLRICIHSFNTKKEIDDLLSVLDAVSKINYNA
jgi:8-amino-7-oxononanoate synthase